MGEVKLVTGEERLVNCLSWSLSWLTGLNLEQYRLSTYLGT